MTTSAGRAGLEVELSAPGMAVKDLELHWKAELAPGWKYLGDAWERGYGDLEWKPLDPERIMPWLKMGVNSPAFRMPQDGTFFAVDADCAGQVSTDSVPWEKNRQWLDLLARSGTPLFVSFPRETVRPEQEAALGAALAAASRKPPIGEPLDWQEHRTPSRWLLESRETDFAW